MKKLTLMGVAGVLATSAFAADTYYFQDAKGDHDLANRENWTINNQTTVPATFPPELDTATSGTTHPYMRFNVGGTLALPTVGSLVLQDMIFATADTDWTIDLGSKDKTISIFGNCDSCVWIGSNYPNGQRVTLKSGTLKRHQATQRHTALRIGGSNTTNAKRSWLRIDGPDAAVRDFNITLNSPNCEFCVTNGGYAYVVGNYGIRMSDSKDYDCTDNKIVVSGSGSVLEKDTSADNGFFFGDNLVSPYTYGKGGGIIISDGGAVKKANAAIGNRRGNFNVLMDNGSWTEAQNIYLATSGEGTSTNNTFTAQNGSTVNLAGDFSVGQNGGYNRATFSGSSLTAATVYVGQNGKGTIMSGYGHNELIVTNKSTLSAKGVYVGNSTGAISQYNRLFADDATITLTTGLYVGRWDGGNTGVVQNATLDAGNSISVGARFAGLGYNTLTLSNTTFSASTTYIGGETSDEANACNNTLAVIDSTFSKADCDWHMGLYGGGTNHVVIAHSKTPIRTLSLGRRGRGYNTLLVTNCTEFSAGIELGGSAGISNSGTDGNVVRFVDSTIGSADKRTTNITLANSYGSSADFSAMKPSRSNRVEFVRSTWYNSASWFGVGGWDGARCGGDDNALIVDDHSFVDLRLPSGNTGMIIGYAGFRNRVEVKNGSTFKVYSCSLGATHNGYLYNGTNTLYVGKDSLFTCESWFTTSPGGSTIIIEDGTFQARYQRNHYYYSLETQGTKDGLASAEKEFGKTAQEIWGTRWVLKGYKPVLCFPLKDAMETLSTGIAFDRSSILEIEFPSKPYAAAPIQSSLSISFGDGSNYKFDFSKVERTVGYVEYPLAEVEEGGTLKISEAELANLNAVVAATAKAAGYRASVYKSSDGLKLVMRVRALVGFSLIVR